MAPQFPWFLVGFFTDLAAALRVAWRPTFHAVCKDPIFLLRPFALRRVFFANVWDSFAASTDENGRAVKQGLITPRASGIVLEIGAGLGHTMPYLDKSRVKKYIALEPNRLMHTAIRETAASCGFSEYDGTLGPSFGDAMCSMD